MNYINDRVVIVEKERINVYAKESGKNHQCYLDEFAKKHGYDYSTMDYLAREGNCIFEMMGPIENEFYIISYMPKKLTDMQLYFLESMDETFENANRIEAIKVSDKDLIHFDSNGQNAGKYFNDTIIGSYYKNDVVKKL